MLIDDVTARVSLSRSEAAWLRAVLSNPQVSIAVSEVPLVHGLMVKLGMIQPEAEESASQDG